MTKTFQINHVTYSRKELLEFAAQKAGKKSTPEWEKDLYQFITEWFSPKETVSIFTSGSTGTPKEVKLKKDDIIKSAARSIAYFELNPGENALLCLSVKYIAGMLMVVRAFTGNLNLITISPQQFDLSSVTADVHFAAIVPLQLEKALNSASQINRIKKLIIGGATIPLHLVEKLSASFSGKAWETYGMTETITHVAVRELVPLKNEVFESLPGVSFSTDNRECLIISDLLIQKEPIITNDTVELISSSKFKLIGRIDSVINSGGIKIQPEKLEDVLSSYIRGKFCISSVPDEKLGEMVVLVTEVDLDADLLQQALNHIDNYQRPKKIIRLNSIPLKSNGKLDRITIKQRIKNF